MECLEIPKVCDDNVVMSTTAKKWIGKNKTLTVKAGQRRPSAKAIATAKDRAERRAIGKTLDLTAFMADFKRDTTSAAYWETEE